MEKVLPPDPQVAYPICTAGNLSGPPEDCGGVYGYYRLLEVLQDPDDEEYEDMLRWVGEGFDPDAFSVDEVNRFLKPLQRRPSRS